jgi:hypothetical protein
MKQELNRLVQSIPVTDPRSSEYHMLLRSIEYLDSMGGTIEEILAEVFDDGAEDSGAIELQPTPVISFPKPAETEAETEAEAEPTYSAAQVRKALVDARSKGVDIKTLMAKVGADNFQGVPAAKYGAIMKELGVV